MRPNFRFEETEHMPSMLQRIVFGSLLIIPLGACNNGAPADKKDAPATITQEDKALLERIKAKEKAKADLKATPSKFVVSGGWDKLDRGFLTRYTKATAVEFTNHSD